MDLFILDDERLLREALAAYLSSKGVEVRLATGDPEEFLEAARGRPPRAAIVDLFAGGGSPDDPRGLVVLERLRECALGTSVVMLTTPSRPDAVRRALELGAAACLEKHQLPVSQLLPLLERAAAGERVIPFEAVPLKPSATAPRIGDSLTPASARSSASSPPAPTTRRSPRCSTSASARSAPTSPRCTASWTPRTGPSWR